MKLEKALKNLDAETVKDLESLSPEALKQKIVDASESMRLVAQQLEDNPKYQEIKENKKALEQGKKEVNARQNAIIAVALSHLNGNSHETE